MTAPAQQAQHCAALRSLLAVPLGRFAQSEAQPPQRVSIGHAAVLRSAPEDFVAGRGALAAGLGGLTLRELGDLLVELGEPILPHEAGRGAAGDFCDLTFHVPPVGFKGRQLATDGGGRHA